MSTKKIPRQTHGAEECPITATIDVIGGKWKPETHFGWAITRLQRRRA
jgi:DNA-binding HxlR family transcriptional regulator